MGKIRVIVAEGSADPSQPTGLLRALLEEEGVEVAGEVLTIDALVQLAADEQPDAVVFADAAPRYDIARLRRVSPGSKIILVSHILTAAEAELATAVVERTDVLRSLGPVLVLLCTPGRATARRAITESFDRPDWIDRVRKDPAGLRDILGARTTEALPERPSISALQGQVRAGASTEPAPVEDVVVIPEAQDADDPPASEDGGSGRAARMRTWFPALMLVLFAALAALFVASAHVSRTVARSEGGDGGADRPRSVASDPLAGHRMPLVGLTTVTASKGADPTGIATDAPAGGGYRPGQSPTPDPDPAPGGGGDPGQSGTEHGRADEHNPHGEAPGRSGDHPLHGGALGAV